MLIKTSDTESIAPFIKRLKLPEKNSHKGQNGRLLIIGGSRLFHAASLWPAEIASHFVDLVHYCSTEENAQIFINLKTKFTNGIVIEKKNLLNYVEEDDCILIGPGMIRGEKPENTDLTFDKILSLESESAYTYHLTKYLLKNYPEKKFVIDGGSLQMMDKAWLKGLKIQPILTPHQGEFERLFGIKVDKLPDEKKTKIVIETAKQFNSTVILKAVDIIISGDQETYTIRGGNPGLTKGGTGDVLAGLTAALNTKNSQLTSSIIASLVIKISADIMSQTSGFWFNTTDLIAQIPKTIKMLSIY